MKASNTVKNNLFNKNNSIVYFDSYQIERNTSYGGFGVRLTWSSVDKVVFYKIYKAILPKSTLNKSFEIDQKGLEFLTQAKILGGAKTNILYNKENFVENKNVKLLNTSSRFGDVKRDYKFFEIAQISAKKGKKIFDFYDKNIKFGKAYAYIVTATDQSIQESRKEGQVVVNIQDLESPNKPQKFTAVDSPNGMNLFISNEADKDVQYFDLFRRNKEFSLKYELVKRLEAKHGVANFLDTKIVPGNEYEYKCFSVDLYKNLSLESAKITKGFNQIFINDATIPYPEIKITKNDKFLKFVIHKNHPNLIGASIQRKDVWRNEQDFSFKNYSSFEWPNIFLFKNDVINFQDIWLDQDKRYQYRIFTVLKNQRPGAYYVSPIIVLNDFKNIIVDKNLEQQKEKFKLNNYQFSMIDKNQNPVFLQLKINTSGYFTHFKILLNEEIKIVDSFNSDVFLKINQKTDYLISIKFYDEENLLNSVEGIKISTK